MLFKGGNFNESRKNQKKIPKKSDIFALKGSKIRKKCTGKCMTVTDFLLRVRFQKPIFSLSNLSVGKPSVHPWFWCYFSPTQTLVFLDLLRRSFKLTFVRPSVRPSVCYKLFSGLAH